MRCCPSTGRKGGILKPEGPEQGKTGGLQGVRKGGAGPALRHEWTGGKGARVMHSNRRKGKNVWGRNKKREPRAPSRGRQRSQGLVTRAPANSEK